MGARYFTGYSAHNEDENLTVVKHCVTLTEAQDCCAETEMKNVSMFVKGLFQSFGEIRKDSFENWYQKEVAKLGGNDVDF